MSVLAENLGMEASVKKKKFFFFPFSLELLGGLIENCASVDRAGFLFTHGLGTRLWP